ncbi:MAG: hypothetical protein IKL65_00210 [Bacilli bacterium]|nr:hypothetical protein [Bacilli bacterium]
MKIIDLLNKIAKGEMIGTKFEYENDYFMVGDSGQINRYTNESFKEIEYPYDNLGSDYDSLNDEIEIIEDVQPIIVNMTESEYMEYLDWRNEQEFEPFKEEIDKINYYQKNKTEFQVDYKEDGEIKHFCLNKKQRYFADKVNELIDEVNKLKKGEK